ncbi:MAG: hypothetical protein KC910_06490 [Candidatus Eremiobacteraeota bacterium]|nr:hypothetical protein [Candidatus Eremiobacteraeota bacterium]
MIALHPTLVTMADALLTGEEVESASQTLSEFLADSRRALAEQADFFVSDEEQGLVENLGYLLAQFEREWPGGFDGALQFTGLAMELSMALHQFRLGRLRTYFVEIPALDLLLVALVAHLQGRGQLQAATRRLAGAGQSIARLARDYARLRQELPEELVQVLDEAFAMVNQGLEAIEQDRLHEAARLLRDGGTLLSNLVQWRRKALAEFRSPVPILGVELARLRQAFDADLADEVLERSDELLVWWNEASQALLVPLESHDACVEAVEQALTALLEAEEQEQLLEAAEQLEAAFSWLDDEALDLHPLVGTSMEDSARLLSLAYRGETSRAFVMAAGEGDPYVRAFLESGDRAHLLLGLQDMLEQVAQASERGPTYCTFCGLFNEAEHTVCIHCQHPLSALEVNA